MPQSSHRLKLDPTTQINYLLHLPDAYQREPQQRWPFILFLHGSGERGDVIDTVRTVGLPKRLEVMPDFPFIVLSPQCPNEERWPEQADKVMRLVDTLLPSLRVDKRRVYLTGLSLGGEGAWFLGALHPERFAAVLPICGRIPAVEGFPQQVCELKSVPVWVFHGAQDAQVPVENSVTLAKTLADCGGNVTLTIFEDGDHFCWGWVYENPATWEWLMRWQK